MLNSSLHTTCYGYLPLWLFLFLHIFSETAQISLILIPCLALCTFIYLYLTNCIIIVHLIFLSFLLTVTASGTMHLASVHQDYHIHGGFACKEGIINSPLELYITHKIYIPLSGNRPTHRNRQQHDGYQRARGLWRGKRG